MEPPYGNNRLTHPQFLVLDIFDLQPAVPFLHLLAPKDGAEAFQAWPKRGEVHQKIGDWPVKKRIQWEVDSWFLKVDISFVLIRVYGGYNMYTWRVSKPTNKTGGPHIVTKETKYIAQ